MPSRTELVEVRPPSPGYVFARRTINYEMKINASCAVAIFLLVYRNRSAVILRLSKGACRRDAIRLMKCNWPRKFSGAIFSSSPGSKQINKEDFYFKYLTQVFLLFLNVISCFINSLASVRANSSSFVTLVFNHLPSFRIICISSEV